MSGMSSMLRIPLGSGSSPSPRANEKGNCRSRRHHPEKLFPFITRIARGVFLAWMDSQDLTHAAHAFDPWVLDAYTSRLYPIASPRRLRFS